MLGRGGTRHFEMLQHCARNGVAATVVASDISYLTGTFDAVEADSATKGINIIRAYTAPVLHKGFTWRVVSFLSFMLTSFCKGLMTNSLDVVIGTSPPIFQALSACMVAQIKRKPFLLEIRDLWPAFAVDMGVLTNPVIIWIARRLEKFLYNRASHLLVNSPAYRDYLISVGVPPAKVSFIPNGVDPAMFDPESTGMRVRKELHLENRFVVTYAGALGLANDIDTLLESANLLRGRNDVHFLIVGDGGQRGALMSKAAALQLGNVTFVGAQPKSLMREFLAASDACVAILQDIPMFQTTYPNKVFDYMAAGRPTILAIDGVIRRVLEESVGGICVNPGNAKQLAEAVAYLRANPNEGRAYGQRAREYVCQHFSRGKQAGDFLDLLRRVSRGRHLCGIYQQIGKRIVDILCSALALIALSPVLLLLGAIIGLTIGHPILFRQRRPGLWGEPFTILKFRTMKDLRDSEGNLLPDADRLTRVGKFLRSTSLDELPELLNILMGQMSLVGPRPLLMEYLPLYDSEQARRHHVKPGLTGLAQINGRNAIEWEEKFRFDVWYVDHVNLRIDLKILVKTAMKVFTRDGITSREHATMPAFSGSRQTSK